MYRLESLKNRGTGEKLIFERKNIIWTENSLFQGLFKLAKIE